MILPDLPLRTDLTHAFSWSRQTGERKEEESKHFQDSANQDAEQRRWQDDERSVRPDAPQAHASGCECDCENHR